MNWKKISLLSVAITLGAVGGIGTFSTASVYAATAKESSTVYKQFGQYVSKPSTLAQARNYLINHIDEADTWTATRMTLQSLLTLILWPLNLINRVYLMQQL